ncbi:MAG: glycogen synthase GlgA [Puniceicoccales bacterium]|jgi:starch synthase|nr:glycogen synthase GlgA [Puniceicoccales bacterium]
MKILLATSECEPYAKVGGLGDVVQSLATTLKKLGNDVRIVMPKYGSVNYVSKCKVVGGPMIVNLGYGVEFSQLLQTEYEGVPIYFIEFDKYFARNGIYGEFGESHSDNWERFAFFCRAVIDMCPFLNWAPDVIHSNDWPTGLIPALLSLHNVPKILKNTASVFTIHNMAHHGYAPKKLLNFAGLYDHYWHPFAMEACGAVNVMKGALQFADKITTVSRTYAEEIKTPAHGYGLDDVLRYRAGDLIGICNGVDAKIWNPATDKFLPRNFSPKSMDGKKKCKQKLQNDLYLPVNGKAPIFGVISRFFHQKGLDILCDILPNVVKNMDVQFAILGSGDPHLEWRFSELTRNFSGKIAVRIGFNSALAHLIEAGSDFFVMPSRYEPCGLNQMYSMLYGTLPIVHATGGLVDTVENYDESTGKGTGFVFNDLTHGALYNTIGWACATYYDRPKDFAGMRKCAMGKNFSWERSAAEYELVYSAAVNGRKLKSRIMIPKGRKKEIPILICHNFEGKK